MGWKIILQEIIETEIQLDIYQRLRVDVLKRIVGNTMRIARLKLLFFAAKVVKDGNVNKVKYSIHDARTPTMLHVLKFLDQARSKWRFWRQGSICPQLFAS